MVSNRESLTLLYFGFTRHGISARLERLRLEQVLEFLLELLVGINC
ncbi:hypothetical protein OB919_09340 [Halobacteria archaeon AArc-curdl1]|uniref:Uncharacterized protein n=1 Tax=Natronosalvus hydrolyticus TaxID=2979988 RepID=A0AAP3E6P2_9EURY|nr:hypothetical protein [Halobacteria archaeon AArc-curdl1]